MHHHWLPFTVTTLGGRTPASSQPTSIPGSIRRKRRKSWGKTMTLMSITCLVLVLALLAVKLVTAGVTAILWGIGILNVSCVLGGLASYWGDAGQTTAVKRKALTATPVASLSPSETLEPLMPDSRYHYEVGPLGRAPEGRSSQCAVSASAA